VPIRDKMSYSPCQTGQSGSCLSPQALAKLCWEGAAPLPRTPPPEVEKLAGAAADLSVVDQPASPPPPAAEQSGAPDAPPGGPDRQTLSVSRTSVSDAGDGVPRSDSRTSIAEGAGIRRADSLSALAGGGGASLPELPDPRAAAEVAASGALRVLCSALEADSERTRYAAAKSLIALWCVERQRV
jgi:hypothetical protein